MNLNIETRKENTMLACQLGTGKLEPIGNTGTSIRYDTTGTLKRVV